VGEKALPDFLEQRHGLGTHAHQQVLGQGIHRPLKALQPQGQTQIVVAGQQHHIGAVPAQQRDGIEKFQIAGAFVEAVAADKHAGATSRSGELEIAAAASVLVNDAGEHQRGQQRVGVGVCVADKDDVALGPAPGLSVGDLAQRVSQWDQDAGISGAGTAVVQPALAGIRRFDPKHLRAL
jgi:hypothetical protein